MERNDGRGSRAGWWAAGGVTVVAAVAIAAMASASAARDSAALLIPSGWESMAPCAAGGAPVPASDLWETSALRGCNAEGTSVVFPDGHVEIVAAVGVSGAHRIGDVRYTVDNWGGPGVVAVMESPAGIQYWGTSQDVVRRQIRFEAKE